MVIQKVGKLEGDIAIMAFAANLSVDVRQAHAILFEDAFAMSNVDLRHCFAVHLL